MRSLALTKYSSAAGYQLLELPVPALEAPDDVLVRVHAAGVNAGDCKLASGAFHFMMASSFPYKFAHDLSGTVAAVGEAAAAKWAVGDEVFGMLPITRGGSFSHPVFCAGAGAGTGVLRWDWLVRLAGALGLVRWGWGSG